MEKKYEALTTEQLVNLMSIISWNSHSLVVALGTLKEKGIKELAKCMDSDEISDDNLKMFIEIFENAIDGDIEMLEQSEIRANMAQEVLFDFMRKQTFAPPPSFLNPKEN